MIQRLLRSLIMGTGLNRSMIRSGSSAVMENGGMVI